MSTPTSNKNILSLQIRDQNMLFYSYMPFLTNGGLFVPTNKSYKMGDKVYIILTLMDEAEKLPIVGHVAWINPSSSHSNNTAGVGVSFSNEKGNAEQICSTIEKYLVDRLNSPLPTYTM